MTNQLPVDRLYHPGIVVRDARATARNYAEIFGITKWSVARCGPDHLSETVTYGLAAQHSFTYAFGTHEESGLLFQLVEPHERDASTFKEFLAVRGQGVHNLCTTITSRDAFTGLAALLASKGIEISQSAVIDDVVEWHFFDTRRALGGFQLMVVVPRADDWMNRVVMDETWDFTDDVTRPAGVPPVPLARVPGMHFGVVVEDVVASMRRYADLFGMSEVSFFEIGTPGAEPRARAPMVTLGHATYHGKPVEHRMLSTLTPVADFGFEVLQVTVPPIHYKEDFYDQVGEGIHHFYATELNADEQWSTLRDWMASIGFPVVQSGEMNCGQASGLGEYFYWDTRDWLGGFVLEVVLAREGFWDSFADGVPTFTLDFSAKVAAAR
jgi:Glyoxalase/Bleomycin resistance protein/Dioxygenase superfamily